MVAMSVLGYGLSSHTLRSEGVACGTGVSEEVKRYIATQPAILYAAVAILCLAGSNTEG